MVVPLILFFTDFFISTLCSQWITSSLLAFFIIQQLYATHDSVKLSTQILTFSLLLVQYTFLHNRFGLALIYLIPLVVLIRYCSAFILKGKLMLLPIVLGLALMIDHQLLNPYILGKVIAIKQTAYQFLSSLMVIGCCYVVRRMVSGFSLGSFFSSSLSQ